MNSFLIHIFVMLLATDRLSFATMLALGNSLLAHLKAETASTEITALITRLEAVLLLYSAGLAKWIADKSRTKGKVDAFSKLVLTIPSVMDGFRTMAKTLMPGDKNVLIVLFGNDISKFYSGSQGQILMAFTNLHLLLADYPLLSTLRTEVADFIVLLKAAYDSKTDIKDDVEIDSDLIKVLHTDLGTTILGTFGRLIDFYRVNPFYVEHFFDKYIINIYGVNHETTRVNQAWVDVETGVIVNAANATIVNDGYFVFESDTEATTYVWTAPTADSPLPENAFEIPGFSKVGQKVRNLGSALDDFLLFKVKEGTTAGRIKVTWKKRK